MLKSIFVFVVSIVFIATAGAETVPNCKDRARDGNTPVPATCFEYAKKAAEKGAEAEMYQHLAHGVEAGFANVKALREDPVFTAFRNEPQFQEFVEQAQKNLTPCAFAKEFRAFDFWIGEWTVAMNGRIMGDSSIQLILDQCVIFENYSGVGGYSGKSFNIYDAIDKKWHQIYVDNAGSLLRFAGNATSDGIDMRGETMQADGSTVLEHLYFKRIENGRVNQVWEQSRDGGKTWTKVFDGIYTRKN